MEEIGRITFNMETPSAKLEDGGQERIQRRESKDWGGSRSQQSQGGIGGQWSAIPLSQHNRAV